MNKQEIINYAKSLGFHLSYDDQWDNPNGKSTLGKWMRFQLPDDLDEKDLRWVWYEDLSIEENQSRGLAIRQRGDKKRKIKEFLQY